MGDGLNDLTADPVTAEVAALTRVDVVLVTHTGLVRLGNEDAVGAGGLVTAAPMTRPARVTLAVGPEPMVLSVADGLGGHAAGEVASAATVTYLAEAADSLVGADVVELAVQQANRRLFDHMLRDPATIAMGCTLALATLIDGGWVLANVGDARAYELRAAALDQRSIDDSLQSGADEGASTGTGFVITQCLGGGLQEIPIEVHLLELAADPDAAIVLCSDGLSDMVEHARLEALVVPGDDEATVAAWLAAALEAGGRDNISILLARPA